MYLFRQVIPQNAPRFRGKNGCPHIWQLTVLALLCFTSSIVTAAVPVAIAPVAKQTFLDANGNPLAFGCVFTYISNTTTPLATYKEADGLAVHTNPIILDAAGRASGGSTSIFVQAGQAYTFKVVSTGGTNCALGTTQYTISGIGGGLTLLTTLVTCNTTCSFPIASQIQLFEVNLTGNATANPLTAVGIIPPAIVIFRITQDAVGGHTFTWPANSVGGGTVATGIGKVSEQMFVWNGTAAQAIGPIVSGNGPEIHTGDIFADTLTALSAVCTDANKKIVSAAACNAIFAVTYNGQTVNPGGSGNVNVGAGAHSVALNQGNGNAITGLALGASQIPIGVAASDPAASTLPTCGTNQKLTYSGTPPLTCTNGNTTSNGTSGSIQFAGGLILQWALGPQRGNSEGTDTTNLPVTCPTQVDNVQVSYYKQTAGASADDAWYQIDSFTTSTVVTYKQSTGGTSDNSKPFVFMICH